MKRFIALFLLVACPWLANATNIQQLIQLTDYVGVDYAVAVLDGEIISPGEYSEMQDFSSAIVEQVAATIDRPVEVEWLRKQAVDCTSGRTCQAYRHAGGCQ